MEQHKCYIEWSPGYVLGVEDMDLQHHFFANLINRLAVELHDSDDPDYQTALVSELNAYARFHFLSEENIMRRHNYPALEQHKQHHRELLEQLSNYGGMFMLKRSEHLGDKVISFLSEWFLAHTLREDRQFAEFLQQQARR